jgi:chromosome partitioning protein
MSKTTVIAIANQKGGVGKTTTAITVASYFATHGRKTLLMDLDTQGHCALGLHLAKGDGVYRLIVKDEGLQRAAVMARPGLDVVANDHTCEWVKQYITQANFKEYVLANILEDTGYDVIILDTPPSTDVLHVLALVASNLVVVPSLMDFYGLDGVSHILKTIRSLGKYPGVTPPALVGVLPTAFDRTTNETIKNILELQTSIGADKILPPIPKDVKVREASAYGQTLWEFAPRCPAVLGYAQHGVAQRNSAGRVGGYLHICETLEGIL